MEATIAAIQRTKEMNTFMSASSQHVTPSAASQDSEEQPLEQRVDNRSQRPDTEAFRRYATDPRHVAVVAEYVKPFLANRSAAQYEV